MELCLKSGAKISTQQHDLSTPVHLACAQGAIDIVKLMFSMQPAEKMQCLASCDVQKMTPLHCAAMFDHPEIVEYLVSEVRTWKLTRHERHIKFQHETKILRMLNRHLPLCFVTWILNWQTPYFVIIIFF